MKDKYKIIPFSPPTKKERKIWDLVLEAIKTKRKSDILRAEEILDKELKGDKWL